MRQTFLHAAVMYGLAIVISFFVALLIKGIFLAIRFTKRESVPTKSDTN